MYINIYRIAVLKSISSSLLPLLIVFMNENENSLHSNSTFKMSLLWQILYRSSLIFEINGSTFINFDELHISCRSHSWRFLEIFFSSYVIITIFFKLCVAMLVYYLILLIVLHLLFHWLSIILCCYSWSWVYNPKSYYVLLGLLLVNSV